MRNTLLIILIFITSLSATETPEVINGHVLPPEPDPAINNSTLLGVDTNNNGVRDDVERWIYKTYDTYIPCKKEKVQLTLPNGKVVNAYEDVCEDKPVEYHQIVREIAMQGARAAQIIIQNPEKARETVEYVHAAMNCNFYFKYAAERHNEPLLIDHVVFTRKDFKSIQFNTVLRSRAFAKYNSSLSGRVFGNSNNERNDCDFDVDALLGK